MSFDARHVADTFVFVAGKIIAKNRYVFAAHDEELLAKEKYRTHLLLYEDGIWSELASFNWQSVGLTIAVKEPLQILVLGRDGQVGMFEGKPSQSKLETKRPIGPMRGITTIGSTVYAYGMKRDVFRRVTSTTWQPFDSGMKAALPTKGKIDVSAIIRDGIKNMGGINSISQVPGGAVHAFGMRGEIWKLLKTTWKRVDSPTNVMLQDSTPRNDGTVWVCGQLGTLISGSDNRWKNETYSGPEGLDFRAIAEFKEQIYLADGHSLRVLVKDELKAVEMDDQLVPSSDLDASRSEILSVAGKEVIVGDGKGWKNLLE